MPTQLDRMLDSKNLFFAFTGIVSAAAAWSIWGGDMFPAQEDRKDGNEPESWTTEDLRSWLDRRNLMAGDTATRAELLARVRANMRAPSAGSSAGK